MARWPRSQRPAQSLNGRCRNRRAPRSDSGRSRHAPTAGTPPPGRRPRCINQGGASGGPVACGRRFAPSSAPNRRQSPRQGVVGRGSTSTRSKPTTGADGPGQPDERMERAACSGRTPSAGTPFATQAAACAFVTSYSQQVLPRVARRHSGSRTVVGVGVQRSPTRHPTSPAYQGAGLVAVGESIRGLFSQILRDGQIDDHAQEVQLKQAHEYSTWSACLWSDAYPIHSSEPQAQLVNSIRGAQRATNPRPTHGRR